MSRGLAEARFIPVIRRAFKTPRVDGSAGVCVACREVFAGWAALFELDRFIPRVEEGENLRCV